MRTISLRGLSRTATSLTETVVVTHANVVIGFYRPLDAPPEPEIPWTSSEITAGPGLVDSSITVTGGPTYRDTGSFPEAEAWKKR